MGQIWSWVCAPLVFNVQGDRKDILAIRNDLDQLRTCKRRKYHSGHEETPFHLVNYSSANDRIVLCTVKMFIKAKMLNK